ncbi:maleylpyruvate isomerase N-terminal domain-containing protein [Streptomyces sp. NPDC004726]
MSDALLNTLAEALADLVSAVSTCDDDVLDPDMAVKWLEGTGFLLDRLPPTDRAALSALLRRAAARRPEGTWRDDVLRIPEEFGLDDDQHELYCDSAEDLTRRFVETVRDADPATPLPSRPGRTLADLLRDHGATLRWTEHLVRTRAGERVRRRDIPLDLPAGPAAYPAWLARSAGTALRTLREVDPETPMWSPGADQRVRFHSRRLFLATVVDLADAELALGREPRLPVVTGADGVDEFLENLPYDERIAPAVRALPAGSLRLTGEDTGAAWTIDFGDGRFHWSRTAREASAGVDGPTGDLFLLVRGRRRPDDPCFTVAGDRGVLGAWLTATTSSARSPVSLPPGG